MFDRVEVGKQSDKTDWQQVIVANLRAETTRQNLKPSGELENQNQSNAPKAPDSMRFSYYHAQLPAGVVPQKSEEKPQTQTIPSINETNQKFYDRGFTRKEVERFYQDLTKSNITNSQTPEARANDIFNYVSQFGRNFRQNKGYTGADIIELTNELGGLKQFTHIKDPLERAQKINEVSNLLKYKDGSSMFYAPSNNNSIFEGKGASNISGMYRGLQSNKDFSDIKDPVEFAKKYIEIDKGYNKINSFQALTLHRLGVKPEDFNTDLQGFAREGIGSYEAAIFAMRGIKPEDWKNTKAYDTGYPPVY